MLTLDFSMFTDTISHLFSPKECSQIIHLAEDGIRQQGGLVGGIENASTRRAVVSWLNDGDRAAWVMDRIVGAVARSNRTEFNFDLSDFKERLQVAAYEEADEGHYDWHADIGEGPLARQRKLTIVTQLSAIDAYEGGMLEINQGSTVFKASSGQGDATLFASFLPHRVAPVRKGRRFSLTCWCHGPAFR